MFTTPDGVSLYTEEDMSEARETQRTQFTAGTQYGIRSTTNDLRDRAITWFRNEVLEGNMTRESALNIFNGLASALDWNSVHTLSNLYTVTVSYNGTIVAEFEDVEADDASSAEDEVSSNMEVEDVEVNFALSYNDHTIRGEANMTYDWSDDFEYDATEQQD
jgi:hypothetical protein